MRRILGISFRLPMADVAISKSCCAPPTSTHHSANIFGVTPHITALTCRKRHGARHHSTHITVSMLEAHLRLKIGPTPCDEALDGDAWQPTFLPERLCVMQDFTKSLISAPSELSRKSKH